VRSYVFERPAKKIALTVDVAPILAVVAYRDPVFSWILLITTERTASKSTYPSPVPKMRPFTIREEIVA
jgi:hypothetical protein